MHAYGIPLQPRNIDYSTLRYNGMKILMEIPINTIHNLIGTPIMAAFAYDTLMRNRYNNNITGKMLGWAALLGSLATAFLWIPVVFTQDQQLLSVSTLLSDICAYSLFLLLAQICIRAFLPNRPLASNIAKFAAVATFAVGTIEAFFRSLSPPYAVRVGLSESGRLTMFYTQSVIYQICSALGGLSLVCIGIYFWSRADSAAELKQKVKIRSVALGFIVSSLGYILVPTFPVDSQATAIGVFLGIGFGIIGLGYSISKLIRH